METGSVAVAKSVVTEMGVTVILDMKFSVRFYEYANFTPISVKIGWLVLENQKTWKNPKEFPVTVSLIEGKS